jgi:serine/threonine protein phosphatase PrpC
MRIEAGSASRPGARERNEDAVLVLPERGVFAVADGMGGLSHGAEMSAKAVSLVADAADELARLAARVDDVDARRRFFEHLEWVYEVAASRLTARVKELGVGAGTTLTTAVIAGGRLAIGHVGDSRAYRIRGAEVDLLTNDHSVAALRYRRGSMTLEEYYTSDQRAVLYEFLGQDSEAVGEVVEADLEPGDVVVLCSDGVWDRVDPNTMRRAGRMASPQAAAEMLVQAALDHDSEDNCSAVVAVVGDVLDDRAPAALLIASHLFGGLDAADLRMLSPYLRIRRLGANELVFREDDRGQELFVVGTGRVEVRRHGVPLVQYGPGDHFGEIAIATDSPRSASVRTVTEAELVVLNRGGLDLLVRRRPGVGARVMQRLLASIGTRLVSMTERAVNAELARR